MSTVIVQHGQGGPEVFKVEYREIGLPGPGQLALKQKAIGFNFIDILFRNGTFQVEEPETVPGLEGAGIVTAVGDGVQEFKVGDRVGYLRAPGAYAAERLIDESVLLHLPDEVSFEQAAALITKGIMARITVRQAYEVKKGDTILVTTAAGGIGSLVVRWATSLGARVIGMVGSEAKRDAALANGAVEAVVGFPGALAAIDRLTQKAGVDAVLDGLGADITQQISSGVRSGGTIVSFGSAAGWPAPDTEALRPEKINFFAPTRMQYVNTIEQLREGVADVFATFVNGDFGNDLPITAWPLEEAAALHADVEKRLVTGLNILIP